MKQKTQFLWLDWGSFAPQHITSYQTGVLVILLFVTLVCGCSSKNGPSIPIPPESLVTPVQKQVVVIADKAVLRSDPDVGSEQVGMLQKGEIVRATGQTSDSAWYLVIVPESQGGEGEAWVLAEFVAVTQPTSPTYTDTPLPVSATPIPSEPAATTPTQAAVTCAPPPQGWVSYTVQRGDTLFSLAKSCGTTIDKLVATNCLVHFGINNPLVTH